MKPSRWLWSSKRGQLQPRFQMGFWRQDDDGAYSYWELAEDYGEFYIQEWQECSGFGVIGKT